MDSTIGVQTRDSFVSKVCIWPWSFLWRYSRNTQIPAFVPVLIRFGNENWDNKTQLNDWNIKQHLFIYLLAIGLRVVPFDRQSKTTYKRVVCFPPTPSELGEICVFWFSGPTESSQFTHQLGEHQRLSPVFWFSGWQTSVRAVQIFSDSGGRYLTGRVGWEMKQISEKIAIGSY